MQCMQYKQKITNLNTNKRRKKIIKKNKLIKYTVYSYNSSHVKN